MTALIGYPGYKIIEFENTPREDKPKIKKEFIAGVKRIFITFVVIVGAHALLPSSKDTAYLVAGHYALKAVELPEAQKIASVLRKKANEFLDEQLKEKQ